MSFNLDQALMLVHTRNEKKVAAARAGARDRRFWIDLAHEQEHDLPDPDGLLRPPGQICPGPPEPQPVFRPDVFRDAVDRLKVIRGSVEMRQKGRVLCQEVRDQIAIGKPQPHLFGPRIRTFQTQRGAVERLAAAAGMSVAKAIEELEKHPFPDETDDEGAVDTFNPFRATEDALLEALVAGEITARSSSSRWREKIPAGQFSDGRCEINIAADGHAYFRLAAPEAVGTGQGVIRACRSTAVEEPHFPVKKMLKRFPYALDYPSDAPETTPNQRENISPSVAVQPPRTWRERLENLGKPEDEAPIRATFAEYVQECQRFKERPTVKQICETTGLKRELVRKLKAELAPAWTESGPKPKSTRPPAAT